MKYYTVLALLPCIPFSWALSLFLLDHGALILGVGKVAKIVALPCLWAYLAQQPSPASTQRQPSVARLGLASSAVRFSLTSALSGLITIRSLRFGSVLDCWVGCCSFFLL